MVEETAALASRLTRRLRKRGWTISTAESCTGGLIASLLTDISGASAWFVQGWIVYSNESKMRELGVEKSAFDNGESGAVSHKVAVQMARGARYKSGSNLAIAVTGIAGPSGSETGKEVGRVHVAVIAEDYFLVRRMDFGENDRLDNKRSFAAFALRLAIEALDRVGDGEKRATSLSVGPSTTDELPIEETDDIELGTEEWEGAISWGSEKKTVSQSLKKIDLASLIDWDE
ncbi:MAG: CinA family protein [Candidatus Thalassarchaeum sp.]|mgnify:CR=1 FL=1|nr:CinA family protein [Candidatus Thalassarchaeum sp.]